MAEVSPNRELGTQNAGKLTIGAVYGDSSMLYNGRVACVKIYNTGFTDDEAMAATKNWECPHEPGKMLVVVVSKVLYVLVMVVMMVV